MSTLTPAEMEFFMRLAGLAAICFVLWVSMRSLR